MSEKIGIIVPVYNVALYIEKCIQGIVKQTYTNWEMLLIDDGSTDGSKQILEKYALRDKRIQVIYKENGGSASARNLGISLINAEYMVFIDADDYVHPQYLELLYQTMQQYKTDIVQCGYLATDSRNIKMENETLEFVGEYSNLQYLELFCKKSSYLRTAVLWNKMYRTRLFDGLEFPEKKGIDDEYLICQIIYRAKSVTEINNTLYYYFLSENSQMRSKPSIKSIDKVDAIETQMKFMEAIQQDKLRRMLLYRYYSSVAESYKLLKEKFPEEKGLISEMQEKKKNWKNALLIQEIPWVDKISLVIRVKWPKVFSKIHERIR